MYIHPLFLFWLIEPLVILTQTELLMKFQSMSMLGFICVTFCTLSQCLNACVGASTYMNTLLPLPHSCWLGKKRIKYLGGGEVGWGGRQMGEGTYVTYTFLSPVRVLISPLVSILRRLSRKLEWTLFPTATLLCSLTAGKKQILPKAHFPSF